MIKQILLICFSLFLIIEISLADWTALNPSINKQILSMTKSGETIFVGTYDSGVWSANAPYSSFAEKSNGVGNKRIHALESANGLIAAGSYGAGVFFSSNNGSNWTGSMKGMTIPYIFNITFDGDRIFACADKGVYVSTDNGTNWTQSLVDNYTAQQIYRKESELFCAIGPSLYRSNDDGKVWNKLVTGNTTLKQVGILTDDKSQKVILVGSLDGMFKSTDDGKKWSSKNSGLSYRNVLSLVIYKNDIFIGTENGGVFQSVDYGETWKQVNQGFPTEISIAKLLIDGTDLYAASSDGVVWKRKLGEMVNSVNDGKEFTSEISSFRIFPNPANEILSIEFTSLKDSQVFYHISDLQGSIVKQGNRLSVQSGINKIDINISSLNSGSYYYYLNLEGSQIKGKFIVD